MSIKDVNPRSLNERLSDELQELEELQPPEWSHYVKTGGHKSRPPENPNWWYLRSASILRRVFESGPIGVSRLRSYYGGRKNRGSAPERFHKGSGKIVRTILQQLEKAGLLTKKKGNGRKISPKGESMLIRLAKQIQRETEEGLGED